MEKTNFFNVADYILDRNIRQGRGHKTAIYTDKRCFTYNEIQEMANKTGNALRNLGLGIDDRLMMLMFDEPQFYTVFFGAAKIGAVPIPVNTMLTSDDYEYLLNDSRAKALAISEELVPLISNIKGDLPYLRDMIIFTEDEAQVPFKHKVNNASSMLKVEYTTKDDVGFWLYSSPEGYGAFPLQPGVCFREFCQWGFKAYRGRYLLLGSKAVFCLWHRKWYVLPPFGGSRCCFKPRPSNSRKYIQPP